MPGLRVLCSARWMEHTEAKMLSVATNHRSKNSSRSVALSLCKKFSQHSHLNHRYWERGVESVPMKPAFTISGCDSRYMDISSRTESLTE